MNVFFAVRCTQRRVVAWTRRGDEGRNIVSNLQVRNLSAATQSHGKNSNVRDRRDTSDTSDTSDTTDTSAGRSGGRARSTCRERVLAATEDWRQEPTRCGVLGSHPACHPDAIPDAIPADVTRLDPRSVVRRMGTIISFAIPILLVPIADPLMSLVDVIFLGQFSTSLNVAGLSPATLIFNFLFCTIMLTRPPIDIDAAHSLLSLPGYPLARPQTVSRRSPLPPWRPWRISSDKARTTRLDSS